MTRAILTYPPGVERPDLATVRDALAAYCEAPATIVHTWHGPAIDVPVRAKVLAEACALYLPAHDIDWQVI